MKKVFVSFCYFLLFLHLGFASVVRIKDVATIQGIRENQLVGYGLVIGLNGTGDGKKTQFTIQSLATMLKNMGITVPAGAMKVKNVAAVIATANLKPFVRNGEKIDVTLSSIGDASSLQGGVLLMTPLKGADGKVYAVAQGPVSIGGFNLNAGGGNSFRKNHATVGRIPEGAIVEREVATHFVKNGKISYLLRNPDFTTAVNLEKAVNNFFKKDLALAKNEKEVEIKIPSGMRLSDFIAKVEKLRINTDINAKVVINERTGTVVVGGNVKIKPIAITHGNLTLKIEANKTVSQPNPLSTGNTVTVNNSNVNLKSENAHFVTMGGEPTVKELADTLNMLGVTPRDVVAIFQAIKASGALEAELIIM